MPAAAGIAKASAIPAAFSFRRIQKTTIVFSYDSQKLSPDGSYAPGDGLASDAVFEFIDSEDADGMKTVTLVAEAGASGSVFA